MKAKQIILFGLVAGMLASCGVANKMRTKKGLFFEGHQFRARSEKVDDVREEFIVTVARASQSVEGAREAGRHEANSYCITNYGRSDMDWVAGQGPDDENIAARIVDDKLVLRGRCKGW
ncbi:hypothetical protein LZG00_07495 [Rhodobacteraceae bacterium LMO-12]|nr:hypothetical protein [Rhodobacteraceae bacterium LMO-JJ12]